MPTLRRAALALALAAQCLAGGALAADYPGKAIKLVVPYAPGGGADSVARIVAKKVSENVGQAIVIENKGGAGVDRRHRYRRQGRARRLHAAARPVRADLDQSGGLQEPALRSGEGFCADHHDDRLSLHPGRQCRAAGQVAAGVRGARQEQAGRHELRLDRRRRRQSPGRRAVQQQGRPEDDPRALSRHGAGGRRSSGRPAHHGVRRSDQRSAAHQVGQAARARRHQPAAFARRARRADRRGERLSRLRGAGLARHPGAGPDASRRSSGSSTRRSPRRSAIPRPGRCWSIRRCRPSAARRRSSPPSSRRTSRSGRRSRRRRTSRWSSAFTRRSIPLGVVPSERGTFARR